MDKKSRDNYNNKNKMSKLMKSISKNPLTSPIKTYVSIRNIGYGSVRKNFQYRAQILPSS